MRRISKKALVPFCMALTFAAAALEPAAAQNPFKNFENQLKQAKQQFQQAVRQPATQPASQPQAPPSQSQPAATAAQPAAAGQSADPTASLSDSDCCTPAAMQKYARQASFLDIVGIKLGMTPQQATAAVHAFDPKLKIDIVKARLDIPGVPEGQYPMIPLVAFAKKDLAGAGSDFIYIDFTTPPNPPLVASVRRDVGFPSGHPVLASTLLAALRKKYGQDNAVGMGVGRNWVYGPDGKLLQRQPTPDEFRCAQQITGTDPGIQLTLSGNQERAADVRWTQTPQDFFRSYEACIPFTIAEADGGLNASPSQQVFRLEVAIYSPAMLYASWRSTQEWLQAKAEAAQQKQEQAVQKNAAPKF
jgi:hypothetical protein